MSNVFGSDTQEGFGNFRSREGREKVGVAQEGKCLLQPHRSSRSVAIISMFLNFAAQAESSVSKANSGLSARSAQARSLGEVVSSDCCTDYHALYHSFDRTSGRHSDSAFNM